MKIVDKKGRVSTSIAVDAKKYQALVKWCERNHTTYTQLVRMLLDEHCNQRGIK